MGLIASVPLVVIGLPATVSHDGTVSATLVTVPEPPPLVPLRAEAPVEEVIATTIGPLENVEHRTLI